MECKAEDPAGHLSGLHPLVFFLGHFDHVSRECSKFLIRRSVVGPLDIGRALVPVDRSMKVGYYVVERETSEVGPEGKDLAVTSTYVRQDG